MNKVKIVLTFWAVLAIACSKPKSTDKKGELDSLKNAEVALKEKIAKLETELSIKDTAKEEKLKLVGVTVMKQQNFNHYIEVQAKVEGDEDVSLGPEIMGTV